jgi:hypothetical protein
MGLNEIYENNKATYINKKINIVNTYELNI